MGMSQMVYFAMILRGGSERLHREVAEANPTVKLHDAIVREP